MIYLHMWFLCFLRTLKLCSCFRVENEFPCRCPCLKDRFTILFPDFSFSFHFYLFGTHMQKMKGFFFSSFLFFSKITGMIFFEIFSHALSHPINHTVLWLPEKGPTSAIMSLLSSECQIRFFKSLTREGSWKLTLVERFYKLFKLQLTYQEPDPWSLSHE